MLLPSISTKHSYETRLAVTAWWESRIGAQEVSAVAGQPEPSPRPCILHETGTAEKAQEAVAGSQGLGGPQLSALGLSCFFIFSYDLAGFGVDLGRKTKLSLPSLGCSLNQTPERCGFEYPNGNLTVFWKYVLQSLGMYMKAEHRHHHHCLLRRGSFAQLSQSVFKGAFPGDSQLQIPDKHRSLPPAATYSTCRHVLLHPPGHPWMLLLLSKGSHRKLPQHKLNTNT